MSFEAQSYNCYQFQFLMNIVSNMWQDIGIFWIACLFRNLVSPPFVDNIGGANIVERLQGRICGSGNETNILINGRIRCLVLQKVHSHQQKLDDTILTCSLKWVWKNTETKGYPYMFCNPAGINKIFGIFVICK